jgi:hypothetical protein
MAEVTSEMGCEGLELEGPALDFEPKNDQACIAKTDENKSVIPSR